MKVDIIITGIVGQGILSIAKIIGLAALDKRLYLKKSEIHGMSKRGGDVQFHLRISDSPIYSELIPKGGADMILSVEPIEALRYLEYLSPQGCIVSNKKIFKNISDYPDEESLLEELNNYPNTVLVDANEIAKELENSKGMNMVMLGVASQFIGLINYESLVEATNKAFAPKGESIIDKNLACLKAGRDFIEQNIKKD